MNDAGVGIVKSSPTATLLAFCLAAALGGLPELRAFTSALVRTSDSGTIRVVPAQPTGGTQPFVYCAAPDVTVMAGFDGSIPVTCGNGLGYGVTLTISYAADTSGALLPPSFSPPSPLVLTVPANGQASTSITVTSLLISDRRSYTIAYSAATAPGLAVDVSGVDFQNTLTVV